MTEQKQVNFPNQFMQTKKQPKIKKSNNVQFIWRVIFAAISVVSAMIINKVYLYQTNPYFQNIKNGSANQLFLYGLSFSVVYTLFDLLVHYLLDERCTKYFLNTKQFADEAVQKRRSYSLVKWGYSLIYYGISSIWAFMLLRNTSYLPTTLGGLNPKGSFRNWANDMPYQYQITQSMRIFYIIQFGKHFARGFGHIFLKSEGNFYQYALHHGLAIFLIAFSYLINTWLIGIWVLLVHDLSDFWLILGRGYDNYKRKSAFVSYLTYIIGFFFWIGCRIVLFMYSLVYIPISMMITTIGPKLQKVQIEHEALFVPISFLLTMLALLQLLQLFWTYHLVKSVLRRTIMKSVKQTYQY